MKVIMLLNSAAIPVIVMFIVAYGVHKKVDVFDAFTEGAKEGLETAVSILPALIALICAIRILRLSGAFDILSFLWRPLESVTHFPSEIVPLAFAKMFSSSAATGVLTDIFQNYGTDSLAGRTASIMMCCTETIFYTLSIYLAPVRVKDSRYIVKCTLFGMVCGIAASFVIASGM